MNRVGHAFATSEATIGRRLRELDRLGYTRKVGRRGRLITEAGRDYLRGLATAARQTAHAQALLAVLEESNSEALLMEVLEARLLIETEIARHAALRIGPGELERLARILHAQRTAVEHGVGATEDIDFHNVIADVSGKRLLKHALALIRHESELSPYVAYMRKQVSGRLVNDHEAILAALECRDPDRAAEAMHAHISGLMADVKRYWSIFSNPRDSGYLGR
jgi:GntR family L-lactate dehydrogenase operon transcriptional regulator